MSEIDIFEGFIFFHLSADSFDAEILRREAKHDAKWRPKWKKAFDWVLTNRPYSVTDWEKDQNTSFDSDDELYTHLRAVYEYIFNDGPADFKFFG